MLPNTNCIWSFILLTLLAFIVYFGRDSKCSFRSTAVLWKLSRITCMEGHETQEGDSTDSTRLWVTAALSHFWMSVLQALQISLIKLLYMQKRVMSLGTWESKIKWLDCSVYYSRHLGALWLLCLVWHYSVWVLQSEWVWIWCTKGKVNI